MRSGLLTGRQHTQYAGGVFLHWPFGGETIMGTGKPPIRTKCAGSPFGPTVGSVHVLCPHCQAELGMQSSYSGLTMQCPNCRGLFQAPPSVPEKGSAPVGPRHPAAGKRKPLPAWAIGIILTGIAGAVWLSMITFIITSGLSLDSLEEFVAGALMGIWFLMLILLLPVLAGSSIAVFILLYQRLPHRPSYAHRDKSVNARMVERK